MDLELELVRHIAAGNYGVLEKNYSFRPEYLGDLGTIAKVKAICHFASKNKVSPNILKYEFSWLDDEHFEEPETDIGYLADKLKKRYAKLEFRKLLLELADFDMDDDNNELGAFYSDGMRRISNIMSSNVNQVDTSGFQDVFDQSVRRNTSGKYRGVSLGFAEVDRHTGGIRPGHLAILAALPKRMKTWFLIKSFMAQSDAGGRPILFSLELSVDEIIGRIACLDSGVSYSRYVSGGLSSSEKDLVRDALKMRAKLGGIVAQPPLGERFVGQLVLEAARNEATSMIIDQFSFLTPVGKHFKENEAYKEIIYDLKNSSVVYDMPIYMAAQLNREQTNDDFPIAQHLGLTRAVEEASDLIMGIQITDEMREDNFAQLGVVEGRHCESGKAARWLIQYQYRERTTFELQGTGVFQK